MASQCCLYSPSCITGLPTQTPAWAQRYKSCSGPERDGQLLVYSVSEEMFLVAEGEDSDEMVLQADL